MIFKNDLHHVFLTQKSNANFSLLQWWIGGTISVKLIHFQWKIIIFKRPSKAIFEFENTCWNAYNLKKNCKKQKQQWHLKVDSNEKWGGSERWQWLGISLGLWRSMAIYHLNMQFLCRKQFPEKHERLDWSLRHYIVHYTVHFLNRHSGPTKWDFADFWVGSHCITYSKRLIDAPI
jgi:hypothetical protein